MKRYYNLEVYSEKNDGMSETENYKNIDDAMEDYNNNLRIMKQKDNNIVKNYLSIVEWNNEGGDIELSNEVILEKEININGDK